MALQMFILKETFLKVNAYPDDHWHMNASSNSFENMLLLMQRLENMHCTIEIIFILFKFFEID